MHLQTIAIAAAVLLLSGCAGYRGVGYAPTTEEDYAEILSRASGKSAEDLTLELNGTNIHLKDLEGDIKVLQLSKDYSYSKAGNIQRYIKLKTISKGRAKFLLVYDDSFFRTGKLARTHSDWVRITRRAGWTEELYEASDDVF